MATGLRWGWLEQGFEATLDREDQASQTGCGILGLRSVPGLWDFASGSCQSCMRKAGGCWSLCPLLGHPCQTPWGLRPASHPHTGTVAGSSHGLHTSVCALCSICSRKAHPQVTGKSLNSIPHGAPGWPPHQSLSCHPGTCTRELSRGLCSATRRWHHLVSRSVERLLRPLQGSHACQPPSHCPVHLCLCSLCVRFLKD